MSVCLILSLLLCLAPSLPPAFHRFSLCGSDSHVISLRFLPLLALAELFCTQGCAPLARPGGRAESARHLAGSAASADRCDGRSELREVECARGEYRRLKTQRSFGVAEIFLLA